MSNLDISVEQVYRFDIITDPDDSSVFISLGDLLSLIENNNKIVMTETELDRGLVRYTLDIFDPTAERISQIQKLTGEISYIPITVSLDLTLYKNYDNIGPVITGGSEIVKVLTEKLMDTKIINVEDTRFDDNIIIYTPITNNNTAVYENPKYLADYYRTLNLNYIGGYQVLSDDLIVRYVLNELYEKKDYIPSDIGVIYINNVALIPVGINDNEVNYYTNIKDRISNIINTRRKEGYFSYSIGIHNLEDIQLIKELAVLWNTDIVYKDVDLIIMKTVSDFGTQPETWFKYNVELIKRGQFPSITVYGLWQHDIGDKNWYSASLHYAGLLAYQKLGKDDPFVQPFTHTVKVNNDYSITLSVPTYNHVLQFKTFFNNILNGFRGLEHQGEQSWYAEPCKDLMDGIVKRYHIQTIDPSSMPMVLPQVYENGNIEQVLVYRSPGLTIYTPNSPYDFKNVDLNVVKTDLIMKLQNYYKTCHGNFEPVLLDRISNMGLEELLNLVEIHERPDQPTYCYSKNTILNLTHPINPLTRRPFTENVVIKAMLMEWGLRGLFNVGPLIGMYKDMPKRILIKPSIGVPIYDKLNINIMLQSITGDIYSVEIGFSDGFVSLMFDIATEKPDELKEMVNKLWADGFFLNYWTSSLEKYGNESNKGNEITSYSVIITNQLLLHGDNSKADGNRGMDFLRESIYNL